jgi:Integrase core domain/GAG-pre-integrase domain
MESTSSHQVYAVTHNMARTHENQGQANRRIIESPDQTRSQSRRSQSRRSQSRSPQPDDDDDVIQIDEYDKYDNNDQSIKTAIRWHNRLGHRAFSTLQKVGIIPKTTQIDTPCKACILAKQTRLPYRQYEHNVPRILWRVHSDMSGMTILSIDKKLYFITFIDDLSRYSWIYFTDRKDAKTISEIFEKWKADAENKSGNKVSYLQTDQGGEYEKEMGQLLIKIGITHLPSTAQRWLRALETSFGDLLISGGRSNCVEFRASGGSGGRKLYGVAAVERSKARFERLTSSLYIMYLIPRQRANIYGTKSRVATINL